MLPRAADLLATDDLEGIKRIVGIPAPVWAGFIQQVGDPGTNIGHLASVPAFVVAQACASATVADGAAFHPINATQVGLVWRVARKTVFLKNGGNEADFVDIEPWDNPRNQGNQNQAPPAVPDPATRTSGVKEHVLKMSSLLDQSDESELVPPHTDKVQAWVQRYVTTMGSTPEEEEEATDAQLAALYKRTVILKQAPYCDFSVWTPFGRRALRSQKFRTYVPLGDGSYLVKELPGPQNLQQWMASWRVFKVAAISLGIVTLSALQQYEKLIERLTLHWPQAWGLIALADDKGRAERLEKLRRNVVVDVQAGRQAPLDWDENHPWSVCFKLLAKDDNFWSEQVRHPASAWLAAGGRGAPVAPADIIAATHLAGGADVVNSQKEEVPERRKQSNRDKRLARKRRIQDERDELSRLRHNKDGHGQAAGKAGGKGKSKDKGGAEIVSAGLKGRGLALTSWSAVNARAG